MIRSFKKWLAKRVVQNLAQTYDGYAPSHHISLYDRLVEWESRHLEVVLFLMGLAFIAGLIATWVSGHENGWTAVGQSLWEAFFVWS